MANRRMFSKEITSSSEFLMMAQSAQNLYFHFGMHADDDGFCEIFTIMRMTDSKPDDLRALHEKGFIYVIDSKVAIVKDWHENNQMRADRYKSSKYLEDKNIREIYLTIMEEKIKGIEQYKALLSSGKPLVAKRLPEVSIGKDSIELNTGGNPTDSAFKENYLSKFKKPKKVYSAAGALADEIHEWDSRLSFPMLLRLIKSKGEQFIRETYAEVKQSDAKEPHKLFMYKIGETKIIAGE